MPSSQTLVSSRLEKLPTELKLTVLSHLNFSELTEARSLNTGFRRLIEKNGTLLVKSLINAYIHQLRQYISFNIYYDPSVTFLEALDRWISLRGLRVWVTQNTFNGVVEFCDHWDEVKNGIHRVNNWPPWNYDMEEVVDAVVKLHAQYHTTDSRQFEALFYEDLDAFIRDCPQNGCERFGLTGQDLTKVYYTIKDTPNWYFESDVWAYTDADETIGNKYGLGPLHTPTAYLMGNRCRYMTARYTFAYFAYFVRSEWAYKKIDQVINHGAELKLADKLRVVQEMFVSLCEHKRD